MANDAAVFGKIRTALVESLGVDESEVTPEAKLTHDLGAESIDFLDIVFKLEKAFDIKMQRTELYPEDILENAEYIKDGKLTSEGLVQLRRRLAFLDLDDFAVNPVVKDFKDLLTVNDMCRFVQSKLA